MPSLEWVRELLLLLKRKGKIFFKSKRNYTEEETSKKNEKIVERKTKEAVKEVSRKGGGGGELRSRSNIGWNFLFIPFFSFSKWKLNYEPLKWFKRKTREKNFHLSSTLSSAILESMMEKERIVRTGCCNHYDASADFMLVIPVKWFIDCQCDEMNYFIFKIYVIFITNSTSSSSPMPISFIHSFSTT